MEKETKFRLAFVAAVAIFAIWTIYPTFQYFATVTGGNDVSEERAEQLRRASVPLGLDLQGGVDVLLAVDEEKARIAKVDVYAETIMRDFRNESPAIDATVEVTTAPVGVTVTIGKPEQVRAADNILLRLKTGGLFPGYQSEQLAAGQPLLLQPDDIRLNEELNDTIDSALKVIRDRVDKLGVTQPVVVKQGSSRIRVQIPGEKNPEEVLDTIIKPAFLEFKGVMTASAPGFDDKYPENSAEYIDIATGQPLPGKEIPPGYEVRLYKDTIPVRRGSRETMEQDRYILTKKRTELTGEYLKNSYVIISPASEHPVQVHLEFTREGARRFADVTRAYEKKPLAILLDGVVYSAPSINQVIDSGTCFIYGSFSQQDARNLSLILKAGALPAEMSPVEKRIVEATLGADSIRASIIALGIGSLIVALYMMAYYGAAGIVAVAAVLLNIFIIFTAMKMANATLTLSGIGGILLTVGMAVDANILIYERIREELRQGRTMKAAISLGFNRAFSVIFDANLTTLICGLVLLQFGEGSVKGFALSLNIGILATLFTGLFVTRTLVQATFEAAGKFNVGRFKWIPDNFFYRILNLRRAGYTFSVILFAGSLLYVMPFAPFPGSNWGVDFTGGLISEVQINKPMNTQQVQGGARDLLVQKVAGENRFLVRSRLADDTQQQIANTQAALEAHLTSVAGEGGYTILGSESVSDQVGREFTQKAIIAVLFASIGILIYVAFRFEFRYGVAAVAALIHDVVIAYGVFNMLGAAGLVGEVSLDVIAALLVVLGYSVNDTIIIFDRIRENSKLHPGASPLEIINRSICETLNRTIMTVSTVLVVLLVMLFIGGAGLFDFALVLFIGIFLGTYSSILVASPILCDLQVRAEERKKGGAGAPAKA